MSIQSFGDRVLEKVYRSGEGVYLGPSLTDRVIMALDRLNAVTGLQQLKVPRSLRLSKDPRHPERYRIHVKDSVWISFIWQHPHCHDVQLE